jgi:uncharacterized protein
MDEEAMNALKRYGDSQSIPEADLTRLLKAHILVNDNVDETAMFGVEHNKAKFGSRSLEITILTTYRCNLACSYCYQGKGDVLRDAMSPCTLNRTPICQERDAEKT